MPSAKEMQDHERASTGVVAARRSVETRAFLEPIARVAIEADDDPE
jgi:hypothetical protein